MARFFHRAVEVSSRLIHGVSLLLRGADPKRLSVRRARDLRPERLEGRLLLSAYDLASYEKNDDIDLSLGGTSLDNFSGAAYHTSDSTEWLYIVDNQSSGSIVKYTKEGTFDKEIDLLNFNDPEAITHLGGDRFAVAEERNQNSPPGGPEEFDISIFTILPGTTSIDKDTLTQDLPNEGTIQVTHADLDDGSGNQGVEGLAYDAANGHFYFSKEKNDVKVFRVPDTGGTVQAVDIPGLTDDPASPVMTDVSDIYFTEAAGGDRGRLFVMSDESRNVIMVDLNASGTEVDGTIVEDAGSPVELDLPTRYFEAITFSPDDGHEMTLILDDGAGAPTRHMIQHRNFTVLTPNAAPDMQETGLADGSSLTDNITSDTTPTYTGTMTRTVNGLTVPVKNATVFLYVDGVATGDTAETDDDGDYTITHATPLAVGSYDVTVRLGETTSTTEAKQSNASAALAIVIHAPVTSSHVNNVLTVNGSDFGDVIEITENGTNVLVNGQDTGLSLANIAGIEIFAGDGDDVIDLDQVTSNNGFPAALSGNINARGEGDDDTIIGSGFDDDLWGGPGIDNFTAAFPSDVIHDEITTLTELQGMTLNGDYTLGAAIDASPTAEWNGGLGFAPIGVTGAPFTGQFDGQDHIITGLTIDRPSVDDLGLFGYLGSTAVVQNVRLYDVNIDGYGSGQDNTGGLAGKSEGMITNSIVTGTIAGNDDVGGLVGHNVNGTIESSFANVTISFQTNNDQVGGLVGDNQGGTIRQSYAAGSIYSDSIGGGLVGYNRSNSVIEDSYATTDVDGDNFLGGLVGYNAGTILRSYSSGDVVVANNFNAAGFVGYSTGTASYTSTFWDTDKSGTTDGVGNSNPDPAGVTGKTTEQMGMQSMFTGWSFAMDGQGPDGVWFMADAPRLQIEHNHMEVGSKVIENVVDLLMMQIDLSEDYILANDIDASDTANWSESYAPAGSPSSPFTGTLDGQGYKITGLTLFGSDQYVGLFGYTSGATLTDVVIEDIDIDVSYYDQYSHVHVGGLAAKSVNTTITESEVTGDINVTAYGGIYAGGLTGYTNSSASHSITDSSADVDISTTSDDYYGGYGGYGASVGGLAGRVDNVDIDDSSSAGTISAYGGYGGAALRVGGLVGYASVSATSGTRSLDITQSHSTTSTNAFIADSYSTSYGNTYAGGLIGYLYTYESGSATVSTEISESYAEGSVYSDASNGGYGYGGAFAGGLVGYSYVYKADVNVADAYAWGSTTASTYGTAYAGGLIGYTYAYSTTTYVTNTYAKGFVSVSFAGTVYKGGLIGYSSGASYTSSYWDTQTSGLSDGVGNLNPDPAGVTGKTTAQMKTQSTFVGWDFDDIWTIGTGEYPSFLWDI